MPQSAWPANIDPARQDRPWRPTSHAGLFHLFALVLILAGLVSPACLFRRKREAKIPEAPPAPSRVAALPLAVPSERDDLRWLAFAQTVVLTKTIELSPDLEPVPLWQTVPITIEALGTSRSVTPDVASYVASRVAAKWATSGEFSSAKEQTEMLLDFIPQRANLVPYRYRGAVRPESLEVHHRDALDQFLRYLALRPVPDRKKTTVPVALRELALALDKEYGWSGEADPGRAQKVVAELARADAALARLLFNPTLYPVLAGPAAKPRPTDLIPGSLPAPAPPPKAPPPAPTGPPPGERAPAATSTGPPAAESPPASAPAASGWIPSAEVQSQSPPLEPLQSAAAVPPAISPVQPHNTNRQRAPDFLTFSAAAPRKPSVPKVPPATENTAGNPGVPPPPPPMPLSGFGIQVLASRNLSEAEALVAKLRDQGHKPVLESVTLGEKGLWHRVRLTGYATRGEARQTGRSLRASGLIRDFWLIS